MLEFDPNAKTTNQHVFATYIPSRKPKFKTHGARNLATNAINYRACNWGIGSAGIMYEFIGGEWVEIDRYEPPTECAHCKASLERRFTHRLNYTTTKQPRFKDPVVCEKCWDAHFKWKAPYPIEHDLCGKVDINGTVFGNCP